MESQVVTGVSHRSLPRAVAQIRGKGGYTLLLCSFLEHPEKKLGHWEDSPRTLPVWIDAHFAYSWYENVAERDSGGNRLGVWWGFLQCALHDTFVPLIHGHALQALNDSQSILMFSDLCHVFLLLSPETPKTTQLLKVYWTLPNPITSVYDVL